MGKKGGKAKRNAKIAWVLGILLVTSIAFGAYQLSVGGEAKNKINEDTTVNLITGDCNTAPTLSFAVRNALEQGTSVTTGAHYMVNGVYYGTSAPSSYSAGDKIQLILNASDYIDILTDEITLECGANKMTLDGDEAILMKAYTAPSIEIKEDSTVLTDSATGGANNGTALSAGGSETFSVCFTGTDKKTTGDFIYIIETGVTTNVSKVSMYDGSSELTGDEDLVPSFYENTLSSPYKTAFKVPEIVGAKEKCYSLTIVAKSGKVVEGAVYTTAYVGEPLVEDDGSFIAYGTEQKDGDSDYEATFDEDIFLA